VLVKRSARRRLGLRADATPVNSTALGRRRLRWRAAGFFLSSFFTLSVFGADLPAAREALLTGEYAKCIRLSSDAIHAKEYDEEWRLLLAKALLTTGRYPEALNVVSNALTAFDNSAQMRLLGYEVYRRNGQPEHARQMLVEMGEMIRRRAWSFRSGDAANLVALGRALLLLGADPRQVLEQLYDRAKKSDAGYRETYLASGELALDKQDYALAAKTFQEGLTLFPKDADLEFGLAKSYLDSDRPLMLKSLDSALANNPNHLPSLLLLADHLIDSEAYAEAEKMIAQILIINPWQSQAWAYRAALAHLRGDTNHESEFREQGLHYWKSNPEVDHLIGQKLSEKYRFTEGAASQRQALRFDDTYLPAKIQLAQDLLRLGNEVEGWQYAQAAHEQDAYDILTYNLLTLKDAVAKFQTLTNADFNVHMAANEAALYGDQVLALLGKAKTTLSQKYGFEPVPPTVVEIFPEQKDFAVRTFGVPGNPGYLGVCFGSVITANSPASQAGHPANWQAVLWHEFCHVITLQMTRNKMPRWLSEGISVYEERQANPVWGQAMNPDYRQMVFKGQLTPVSQLSGAFLTPKSLLHLQFAYYESELVVEYLVQKFGLDSLKHILRDLGNGQEINHAIEANTAPMKQIEKEFTAFARQRAEELGPGLDWTKPDEDGDELDPVLAGKSAPTVRRRYHLSPDGAQVEAEPVDDQNSTNYWVLTEQAKGLLSQKKWDEAKVPIERLTRLYPHPAGGDNPNFLLAAVFRGLGETNLERHALAKVAAADADSIEAYLRLMQLDSDAKDWSGVAENAERYLAVNPLVRPPYVYLADASDALNQAPPAIRAYQAMLLLDPPDPADVHFRLARLLRQTGDVSAKRHVLQALEEAPRYRDAHRLLLEIESAAPAGTGPNPPATP